MTTPPPSGPGGQPAQNPTEAPAGVTPPPAGPPAAPPAQPAGVPMSAPPVQPTPVQPPPVQPPPGAAPGPAPGPYGGGVAVAPPPVRDQPPAPPMAAQPYRSALPTEKTHLGHAILSEWTKIRSVRSTVWTLAVMFAVTVGIALLVSSLVSAADDSVPPTVPGFFGILLGHIAILTFGVLVMSTEYTSGMIRTTFTAAPQRGRILAAKCLVFSLVSFVMTAAALGLSLVLSDGILGETRYSLEMPDDGWLPAVVGVASYVTLLGLLGIALASLLRSSAGAITLMLGVVLVPTIATPFMYLSESLSGAAEALDNFAAMGALMSLTVSWDSDLEYNGWPQTGVLAIITLVALIGAYARLRSTDA